MKHKLLSLSVAALLGLYWVGGSPVQAFQVSHSGITQVVIQGNPSEPPTPAPCPEENQQEGEHQDECAQAGDQTQEQTGDNHQNDGKEEHQSGEQGQHDAQGEHED